jgi:hypothetical protein
MTDSKKERIAIRGVFQAICKAGVEINSLEEAEAAMELATRLLSYALNEPKMTTDELKPKMLAVILEDMGAGTVH